MFDNIRADMARKREAYFVRAGWLRRTVSVYLTPGSMAIITYRLGRWIYTLKLPFIKQILYLVYFPLKALIVVCFGIHIPVRAEIGKGFVIHNFSCIFIPRTRMGENFTVQQGVTLGSAYQKVGQPTVGNNVFIGAGAKVIGAIQIGDNAVIGANSLVISDVPKGAVVVGVPARIISYTKALDPSSLQ